MNYHKQKCRIIYIMYPERVMSKGIYVRHRSRKNDFSARSTVIIINLIKQFWPQRVFPATKMNRLYFFIFK